MQRIVINILVNYKFDFTLAWSMCWMYDFTKKRRLIAGINLTYSLSPFISYFTLVYQRTSISSGPLKFWQRSRGTVSFKWPLYTYIFDGSHLLVGIIILYQIYIYIYMHLMHIHLSHICIFKIIIQFFIQYCYIIKLYIIIIVYNCILLYIIKSICPMNILMAAV